MKDTKNFLNNILEMQRKHHLFPAVLCLLFFFLAAFWNDTAAGTDSSKEFRTYQENDDFSLGCSSPLTTCIQQLHRSSRTLPTFRFADSQAEKPQAHLLYRFAFRSQRVNRLDDIPLTYQVYSRYTFPVRAGPYLPIS